MQDSCARVAHDAPTECDRCSRRIECSGNTSSRVMRRDSAAQNARKHHGQSRLGRYATVRYDAMKAMWTRYSTRRVRIIGATPGCGCASVRCGLENRRRSGGFARTSLVRSFLGIQNWQHGPELQRGPTSAPEHRDADLARPGIDAVRPRSMCCWRTSARRGRLRAAIVAFWRTKKRGITQEVTPLIYAINTALFAQ